MLLDKIKLQQNYQQLDKFIHDFWKNGYFSKGKYSGYGCDIYKAINPLNYDDFYTRQQEYATQNMALPISKRGLSQYELENLAASLKSFCENKNHNLNYDLQCYIDYITYVNYIQTFDGMEGEKKIVNWLQENGFNAELTNRELDSNYGIDILFGNQKGIQLKSYFFLLSNKESVLDDIEDLKVKYQKAIDDLGIKTYYVFFDKKVGKYISFKEDKILTDFETLNAVLNMDLNERKKHLSTLKRKNLPTTTQTFN